jgi:hypothetical protein
MQGKTRAQKPKLELELDTVTHRNKLVKTSEIVDDVEIRLENCLNVKSIINPLL